MSFSIDGCGILPKSIRKWTACTLGGIFGRCPSWFRGVPRYPYGIVGLLRRFRVGSSSCITRNGGHLMVPFFRGSRCPKWEILPIHLLCSAETLKTKTYQSQRQLYTPSWYPYKKAKPYPCPFLWNSSASIPKQTRSSSSAKDPKIA